MVVQKHTRKAAYAVRLLGFDAAERSQLDALLMQCPEGGPSYTCLRDDSLQEPDFYIADGDGPAGLAALTRANPGPVETGGVAQQLGRIEFERDDGARFVAIASAMVNKAKAERGLAGAGRALDQQVVIARNAAVQDFVEPRDTCFDQLIHCTPH